MRFDFHCHTKEGSIDARVHIEDYVRRLIDKGFHGMLVTDHNSYDGYEHFLKIKDRFPEFKNFIVLKGIEYDTRDSGHMIVVLPEAANGSFLRIRGLKAYTLEKLVHAAGGIMGLAHPFGNGYFAFTNTNFGKKNKHFIGKIDFIETYNYGCSFIANKKAKLMAQLYNKPCTGGSDAHKEKDVGMGYTDFKEMLRTTDDLIRYIKNLSQTIPGGEAQSINDKSKNFIIHYLGIAGYWVYNKSGALMNTFRIRKIINEITE